MRDSEIVVTGAGVYGTPLAELLSPPAGAIQFSPLMPGAQTLEQQNESTLASMTMLAPPGTLERRYAMALALRAVAPGGSFRAHAPNHQGGTRLRKEMQAFGCTVEETARRHHRIVTGTRPASLIGVDEALSSGGARLVEALGVWSQPGVFSWDRVDPGSALLLDHLPVLSGRGADFGCGVGILSRAVLASREGRAGDIDRYRPPRSRMRATQHRRCPRDVSLGGRARRCAQAERTGFRRHEPAVPRRRYRGPRARRSASSSAPPSRFAAAAFAGSRPTVTCPMRRSCEPRFRRVELKIETGGYKIYEARK